MTETIENETISVGRGRVTDKLIFVGEVAGGGAVGPGNVSVQSDYDTAQYIRFYRDDRSGSKRSGSCAWQLQADKLYTMSNIAISSRDSATFYVSTFGGVATVMSAAKFEAERARIWPMGKIEAEQAAERKRIDEEVRIQRDTERAEAFRIEQEALAELNAERAAEIAEKGQPVEEGLPELSGTPKQIAYALNIRKAYAEKNPGNPVLKRGTTAKYWIENHKSVLYR